MPEQINGHATLKPLPVQESSRAGMLLRSESARELISQRPGVLLRWGTTGYLLILVLLAVCCWFIQYPDIVATKAKLTSLNAPKGVVAKADGKLARLFIHEGDMVSSGKVLGYIESTASYQEVLQLDSQLRQLSTMVQQGKVTALTTIAIDKYTALGELQQPYQAFTQALLQFQTYLKDGFYLQKRKILQYDLDNLIKMKANLEEQRSLQEQDLSLAQETFTSQDMLNKEKVISASEYRNEKSKLISKKLSLPQMNAAIISNETSQNGKRKEIMELDNTIAQQKTTFLQAANTMISGVQEWQHKYLLTAPVNGKISYTSFLQENQQVQVNQTLFFVNPEDSRYYAEIYIPQSNFGKVKTGQEVLLRFPSYPSQEFGSVPGHIEFISRIPTDSGYLAHVALSHGLKTDFGKEVQYREGLQAQGDIITANMRLLERFYYNLTKLIRK